MSYNKKLLISLIKSPIFISYIIIISTFIFFALRTTSPALFLGLSFLSFSYIILLISAIKSKSLEIKVDEIAKEISRYGREKELEKIKKNVEKTTEIEEKTDQLEEKSSWAA